MKTKDSIFGLWMSDLGKSMRKSSPVRKPLKATCINVVIFTQFSADKEHLKIKISCQGELRVHRESCLYYRY